MARLTSATAAFLVATLLTGCGAAGSLPSGAASYQGAAARATASRDVQARSLIAAYQAVKGFDAAAVAQRSNLIQRLGLTDSDTAVDFVLAEAQRLAGMPDAIQDAMAPVLQMALTALDTYDETRDGAILKSETVGTLAYEAAAKRKSRRFNIWDGLRKYFKPPHKKKTGGGGGPTPPAPPAPAGGDFPPAPAGGEVPPPA